VAQVPLADAVTGEVDNNARVCVRACACERGKQLDRIDGATRANNMKILLEPPTPIHTRTHMLRRSMGSPMHLGLEFAPVQKFEIGCRQFSGRWFFRRLSTNQISISETPSPSITSNICANYVSASSIDISV
jgi:hypothetical protein